MVIEQTASELVIRFPFSTEMTNVQDLVDYLRYKELTSGYHTDQSVVDDLARNINKNWWNKNKDTFLE